MALNNRFAIRNAIPKFSRARVAAHRALQIVSQHRGVSLLALLTLLVAGAIAPLVGQQKAERRGRENERDSATLIRKRADWFFKQRAYPLGFIPSGARMKAIQQMEEMRRTQGTLMDRFAAQKRATPPSFGTIPALSMTNWTSIGPQPTSEPEPLFFGNTSGRVNAIAVDPCDTTGNTVYIAGAQGGVWKTTNGGTNWTPLTDNQPSLAGGSLAVDPNLADCSATSPSHTGAIYFGTGEENFSFDSFYGAGVLTSHNGGTSWTQDTTFMPSGTPQSVRDAGPFIGALSVQPGSSGATQVLLAGIEGVSAVAHSGVYRSADGGNSWTKVLPASSSTFDFGTGVAFDPGDISGLSAYAVLGFPSGDPNNGLYKSTDGGQTWTRTTAGQNLDNAVTSAGLSPANYSRMTIALAPGNPPSTGNTTIVVAIADASTGASNLLGTFVSSNGGTSFAPANSGPFCNAQCFYDISVGIDPANPNFIFLGGGPNAGALVIGFTQGLSSVIFSSNGGSNFSDVSRDSPSGLHIHVDNHAFAFAHPTSGPNIGQTIVYIGDDGGVWSSPDVETQTGAQSWTNLNNNLNLAQFYPGNSIHPSNPQIGFAGAQDNGTQKFDPTFNPSNGQNWENVESCGDGGWTAIDPATPSTVYAACEAIGNLGTINKNQVDGLPGAPTTVAAPNWIPIDSAAIDNDAINFSTDFVPPMVLDQNNPQNLYFGTYRVWQSTTGGISWNPISPDLTGVTVGNANCPLGCVVTTMAAATDSKTVYAGTDVGGLFAAPNADQGTSATFTEFDKPGTTPGRIVTQIAISPASAQTAYVTYSGFSSCGSANGCDQGLGHVFKFTCTSVCAPTNLTGDLPDIPVNDIVIDPNDNTNKTIYIATDVGVFGTSNGGTNWLPLASSLPHVECTSLKLNNTARVLRVGTHGRGSWDLQLAGLAASALTGMSPTSATAGGGSFTLTLNGQGFPGSPTVNFGSTAALVNSASATQITATVPSGAISGSGVAAVTVTGATGSLNFSIEGPLPILGPAPISPTSVSSIANPVTITISGSNFTANTGIRWTPGLGSSQQGNSSFVPQNAGSLSGTTSFTVTVPASLLATTLSRMAPPLAPNRRPGPDARFWLLTALFAAVVGMLLFAVVPRKRRLIFGTTLTAVVILLSIAGCSSGSGGPPPPGSVIVAIDAYTPGPGGGLSASTQTQSFTVR